MKWYKEYIRRPRMETSGGIFANSKIIYLPFSPDLSSSSLIAVSHNATFCQITFQAVTVLTLPEWLWETRCKWTSPAKQRHSSCYAFKQQDLIQFSSGRVYLQASPLPYTFFSSLSTFFPVVFLVTVPSFLSPFNVRSEPCQCLREQRFKISRIRH